MIFGSGTKLHVNGKEDKEPSVYKLNDEQDTTKACLATGFTRINKLNTTTFPLFNGTEAVMALEEGEEQSESVYTQVVTLTTQTETQCDQLAAVSGGCGDSLEGDLLVNLMSLTVIGLRLIFIKTVIFNVLMTFRLWISQ
ncbi:M1-specific T cell receptor alpha chain-like [Cheilinus undulatus]|uniref:M1-specific T cell receptor alpha chain-like n=1 Tax=Cheilinus undulatus TaxID=241271 RepID=UPI001BD38F0D|nr:M1-specific T cell receptor alpha chain-like [Cheilinus undulatus]